MQELYSSSTFHAIASGLGLLAQTLDSLQQARHRRYTEYTVNLMSLLITSSVQ